MYSLILKNKGIGQLVLSKRCIQFYATKILKIPSIAESIEEVTVSSYLKNQGDMVQEDEEILDVETHKGNFKVRSQASGKLIKYLVDLNADVKIGTEFAEVDTDSQGGEQKKEEAQPKKEDAPKVEVKETKAEAPKPSQNVDKKPEVQQKVATKPEAAPQTKPTTSTTVSTTERIETREKMSRLRRTVAARLKESQNTYAQVTTFQELDMGEIMQMRTDLGAEFLKKYNVKLGFMSFFVKAVTQTLRERPIVNSVIDDKSQEIIHRNFIDISVAVSSPKGLVVPVIKDCQNLNFAKIEQTLIDLANKAKTGELALEDMTGGTFTISNGGVFGSMLSAPIINPPQSAILGMHNIVNRPVVRNGQIVARPVMYVSMSYDHRLLDGREGASFLKRVCDLLEDPRRLLLEH